MLETTRRLEYPEWPCSNSVSAFAAWLTTKGLENDVLKASILELVSTVLPESIGSRRVSAAQPSLSWTMNHTSRSHRLKYWNVELIARSGSLSRTELSHSWKPIGLICS